MDLIVSPAIVALNTHSGAPKPAMTPGQLIDALVLQLIDATTVRLAIADSVVDVKTEVPLQPGMHVRLAVRGHGEETRWVIVGSGASLPPAAPRGPATAQPNVPSSPHAALPATEITIGRNTLATDADAAVASHVRPDQIPNATRPPPPPATTPVATPAAEFARATRSAAARQSGLAPVFAELNALVLKPDVPPPVRQAANQVLETPAQLDGASGETLRQAISKSGLFLESRMAADGRAPPVIGDLKSALLTLRQALGDWLELLPLAESPLKSEAMGARANVQAEIKPPPPYRGAPTGGQQPLPAAPLAETPLPELARVLMTHTDGAIARQVLMQVASLPDASSVAAAAADVADAHWNLEVPFATPQGAAIAHFEIARDAHKGSSRTPAGAAWRVNFSLDFEPMGPVHAQIALTGKRAAVRIWAERNDTAAMLRAGTADLSLALRAASLDAGEVIVRDGAPPRPLKPNPGRFLDRAS